MNSRARESGRALAWVLILIFAVGIAAILLVSPPAGSRLLDLHSQPAVTVPAGMVAVAPDSKTFHVPGCTYIHGPSKLMPAAQAIREGYNPCVRCEKALLRH